MGRWIKIAAILTASGIMAGCAGLELDKANQTASTGSTFNKGLRDGYLALSKSEYDEGDYRDSDYFARSAVAAASGNAGGPQDISGRQLPDNKVDELTNARARLLAALDTQAAQDLPDQAANAQVMFDCWMQEQEENRQPNDIAACRGGFDSAMSALDERNLALAEAEKAKMAKAAPAPAPMPKEQRFVVYFDTDKTEISEAAAAVLAEAKAAAEKFSDATISVVGNTDTVGTGTYNEKLSILRAEAVAQKLMVEGIADAAIKTEGRGMSDLAVTTGPNVDEPRNRRVEIVVKP